MVYTVVNSHDKEGLRSSLTINPLSLWKWLMSCLVVNILPIVLGKKNVVEWLPSR